MGVEPVPPWRSWTPSIVRTAPPRFSGIARVMLSGDRSTTALYGIRFSGIGGESGLLVLFGLVSRRVPGWRMNARKAVYGYD